MQLDDTVEATFSDDTSVDIFHIFIFSYDFAYFLFHTRIDDFVEEFTHSGPTYVIDVVAHEATGDKRCPVCPRSELWSCEEGHERPDERYPCRDRIGEMVESISLHGSTLELPPYVDTTEEESSLQEDDSEQYPERPEFWDTSIRISYTSYSTCSDLYDGEDEEDRDGESCHRLSLAMSVWMILICWFLRVAYAEIYDR